MTAAFSWFAPGTGQIPLCICHPAPPYPWKSETTWQNVPWGSPYLKKETQGIIKVSAHYSFLRVNKYNFRTCMDLVRSKVHLFFPSVACQKSSGKMLRLNSPFIVFIRITEHHGMIRALGFAACFHGLHLF